jgi:octaprenyl-diphosphate synthase
MQVSDFFRTQLDCPDSRLKPFIDYLKDQQGKMLRASFVLLAGRLFGRTTSLHIKIAGIVEMIHTATLLHDDVIDSATERRCHATANSLWGANFAVLLGDYLLSRVFVAVASLQRDDINRLLAETSVKVCRGEMLQNACRGDFGIGIEEYLDIIEKKTAVFFADCCRLGAVASDADEQSANRLYEFGLNFGLSFQIIDDLVDILGAEGRTGKTGGRDLLTRTFTLPVIHAFKVLDSPARNELLEVFDSKQADINRIVSILHTSKSIDFAKSCAQQYRQKALLALEHFGPHPAAAELKNLIFSVTKTLP